MRALEPDRAGICSLPAWRLEPARLVAATGRADANQCGWRLEGIDVWRLKLAIGGQTAN